MRVAQRLERQEECPSCTNMLTFRGVVQLGVDAGSGYRRSLVQIQLPRSPGSKREVCSLVWIQGIGGFDSHGPDHLGVVQLGRARASDARDCRFKSCHPDCAASATMLPMTSLSGTTRPTVGNVERDSHNVQLQCTWRRPESGAGRCGGPAQPVRSISQVNAHG